MSGEQDQNQNQNQQPGQPGQRRHSFPFGYSYTWTASAEKRTPTSYAAVSGTKSAEQFSTYNTPDQVADQLDWLRVKMDRLRETGQVKVKVKFGGKERDVSRPHDLERVQSMWRQRALSDSMPTNDHGFIRNE